MISLISLGVLIIIGVTVYAGWNDEKKNSLTF